MNQASHPNEPTLVHPVRNRAPRHPGLHQIDFQFTEQRDDLPSENDMRAWIELALANSPAVDLTVRFATEAEMASLNQRYRHKTGSTNVLSFPGHESMPDGSRLLGDIVVCPAVLVREAGEQKKSITSHTAHLLIHGALHLRGYDHETDAAAREMESLETRLLDEAGFDDPYQVAIQTALQREESGPILDPSALKGSKDTRQ